MFLSIKADHTTSKMSRTDGASLLNILNFKGLYCLTPESKENFIEPMTIDENFLTCQSFISLRPCGNGHFVIC